MGYTGVCGRIFLKIFATVYTYNKPGLNNSQQLIFEERFLRICVYRRILFLHACRFENFIQGKRTKYSLLTTDTCT